MTKNSLSINYYGYFTPFGGYGIANMNWVKHLRRLGVQVFPHGKFMPVVGTPEYEVLNDEEKEIAAIPFEKQRIGVIETTPFDFNLIDNEVKVANTMAENDTIGKPWVNASNRMDYVLVPNKFQETVFKESGVESPVFVIPHGTETEKFPYFERPKREIFTFGIVGWLNDRKGVFDVIRAFASEFDNNEPVRLILKTSNPSFGYYSNFNDPRITTINKLTSPEELNLLYQSLDCFVFPSKAEGIGQPPREAMATGLPVILTKWSGLSEISLKSISYPIEPIAFTERKEWEEQPGNWAEIDIAELMYWMRYVYEHQSKAKLKGKKAAEFIRKNYSWEAAAKAMKCFLETL